MSLNTAKQVPVTNLEPKKNSKQEPLPVKAGQSLALKGKKEKHKVLEVLPNGMAVMRWQRGVKPEKAHRTGGMLSGWELVT